MALKLSKSNSSKLSTRPLTSTYPKQAMFGNHHATVNCNVCHRTMVPRVVSYYGQPLRSICPFCGTTFMKFPSDFQRFVQRLQPRILTFDAFKKIAMAAICFGLLWFISLWAKLPEEINFVGTVGTIALLIIAAAELTVQCVEHLAAKLSHESNYYWAGLVLITVVLANKYHDLINYVLLFLAIMLVRWVVVDVLQIFRTTR